MHAVSNIFHRDLFPAADGVEPSKPELTGVHPRNTTARSGEAATFHCQVKSDTFPLIQVGINLLQNYSPFEAYEHCLHKIDGLTNCLSAVLVTLVVEEDQPTRSLPEHEQREPRRRAGNLIQPHHNGGCRALSGDQVEQPARGCQWRGCLREQARD